MIRPVSGCKPSTCDFLGFQVRRFTDAHRWNASNVIWRLSQYLTKNTTSSTTKQMGSRFVISLFLYLRASRNSFGRWLIYILTKDREEVPLWVSPFHIATSVFVISPVTLK